jgi:hypothetical protein
MTLAIEGGCRCGEIRYSVKADKLPNAYACHCLDCQTWSGSAFSLQFIVPEDALTVTGTPHLYERPHPDGDRTSYQYGCAKCLTRVWNTNTRRPGLAVVRAGTLSNSDQISVIAHIWTKRKLTGIDIPADIPQWPEAAPPLDFIQVMSK